MNVLWFFPLMFNWQKLCRPRQVTNDHQRNKYCFFLSSPLFDPAWITHICPLQQCLLNGVKKRHRCTVVGNPGGPWGFGQILLRGVLAVVRKCRRVPFLYFIAFLCDKFLELTPSLPLPPPPCASLRKGFLKIKPWFTLSAFFSIYLFIYFFTSFTSNTVECNFTIALFPKM